MLIVAIKLACKRGMLRERIWMLLVGPSYYLWRFIRLALFYKFELVTQESSDDRKNVWWSAPKLARERGFDLRKILQQAKSEGDGTSTIRC